MHHLTWAPKLALYKRIRQALAPTGKYIEGDYVVSEDEERERAAWHCGQIETGIISPEGIYHIDIPFSVATQQKILLAAGFATVEILHLDVNGAVLSAC